MSLWVRVYGGVVCEETTINPSGRFDPSMVWIDATGVSPQPAQGWTAAMQGGVWSFSAQPSPPSPTLAQQAAAAIESGVSITSTSNPSLNGLYSCDAAAQSRINGMFNMIQRAGGTSFPAGMTALPWPVAGGTVTFSSVADFLNVATAIADYVLALGVLEVVGTGTLPSASVTIS